jgi:hypothetical protein
MNATLYSNLAVAHVDVEQVELGWQGFILST